MKKFTKDGEEFEGVQWMIDIESEQELAEFTGGSVRAIEMTDDIIVEWPDFGISLEPLDWLMRDKDGRYKGFTDEEVETTFEGEGDFWVECNVCKAQLKNWSGSTPCCGSIAYIVEKGVATNEISLFASINGGPIEPTKIDTGQANMIYNSTETEDELITWIYAMATDWNLEEFTQKIKKDLIITRRE